MTRSFAIIGLLATCLAPQTTNAARASQSPAALRIVVLKGEDAVNVIQRKTAVAPIVEVRDRNNLPVAGATVTFSVGQGATFSGASTLTVATNAAGQAIATGLTPTIAGTIQVQATAVFQGQTAIATIAQSNVMTAAQAAAATGASGGATSGGGGGISGTTLGIAGAGVGAAVIGLVSAGGGEPTLGSSASVTSTPATPTAPVAPVTTTTVYSGQFSGQHTENHVYVACGGPPQITCSDNYSDSGAVTLTVQRTGDNVSGTFEMVETSTRVSASCPSGYTYRVGPSPNTSTYREQISGTAQSHGFEVRFSTVEDNNTSIFRGSISGNVINGTLTESHNSRSQPSAGETCITSYSSARSLNLVLR